MIYFLVSAVLLIAVLPAQAVEPDDLNEATESVEQEGFDIPGDPLDQLFLNVELNMSRADVRGQARWFGIDVARSKNRLHSSRTVTNKILQSTISSIIEIFFREGRVTCVRYKVEEKALLALKEKGTCLQ